MLCEHKNSGNTWLPRPDNNIIVQHPVCNKCGYVKNITGDRGKKLGYYINSLFEIKDYLKKKKIGNLSKVQIRLITLNLENIDGFEDVYWIHASTQNRMFIEIVKRYTDLTDGFIESFL